MSSVVRLYLSEIGGRGGKRSRRVLPPREAARMVQVREARRAFRRFFSTCFWSFDRNYSVTHADVPWVLEHLRKNGGRGAHELARRIDGYWRAA